MKIICTFILIVAFSLIAIGCTSTPTEIRGAPIVDSTISTETIMPTSNGLAIRETDRVGTVYAIQTASATLLPSPSAANTPTAGPTSTPKPFSKDDVLISYTIYAGDGVDEITSCVHAYFTYRFVLYRDGRLIIFEKTRYLETRISQTEISKLLSEIDATGISSIIDHGDPYIQGASTSTVLGGWSSAITIREKDVSIEDSRADFLAKPVKMTLDIIENYNPGNLRPYAPDSATIWIFLGEDIILGVANPTPEPPSLNWSVDDINLDDLLTSPISSKPQVISGETLSFLMEQLEHIPAFRRVEQNGQNYLVLLCPNFL